MKQFLFFLASILTLSSFAQNKDSLVISKFSYDILNNGKAYENLRYLCKEVGHRISGSPQAQQAVEASARMLREAGADTVYLQPVIVPYWLRGDKEQGVIHFGNEKRKLNVVALGMSVATPPAGITADIIEVKNFDELKALGADQVKGKIVFFNYAMRPELIQGGYGDAVKYRGSGPVEAAKLGAVGVMIRSVTHALDDNPHTGSTRYDSAVTKIPAMACSTKDAEWLSALLKKEKKVQMFMNEENGLRGGNAYADSAIAKKENHIFAIESDAGGFGVQTLGISGTPEQEQYLRQWTPLFRPYGVYEMPGGGGGADIGPLRKLGTVLSGVNPGTQRYFDLHHAPNDVFEAVNKRELELGALAMTAITYLVSEYGLPAKK